MAKAEDEGGLAIVVAAEVELPLVKVILVVNVRTAKIATKTIKVLKIKTRLEMVGVAVAATVSTRPSSTNLSTTVN